MTSSLLITIDWRNVLLEWVRVGFSIAQGRPKAPKPTQKKKKA